MREGEEERGDCDAYQVSTYSRCLLNIMSAAFGENFAILIVSGLSEWVT